MSNPRMRAAMLSQAALLLTVAGVLGCARIEPYARPGEWRPLGANSANLRAMIADPRDLYQGREAVASRGDQAAAAVGRLRRDATRVLPDSGIADVRPVGTGAAQPESSAATPQSQVAAPPAETSP